MSGRMVLTEEERKERRREYNRQWRQANPECGRRWSQANKERRNEQQRKRRAADPEKDRERTRRYAAANREQLRESAARYREANPEKVRDSLRKYREANKEKLSEKTRLRRQAVGRERLRERRRQWAKANPEKEHQIRIQASRARRARKASALDPSAPQVTAAATARRVWLFGNACAYCGSDGPLHLDHVEPLARGGLHTPDNLVPACQRCNLSKQAKPVEAWYLSQPFFSPERWEALQAHTGRRWSAAEQLSLMDLLSA